ncbi:MAG: hypothetical protein V8S85_03355 [Oscillospiraceae bacterium]
MTATDNQNTTGDTSTDVVPEPKKDEEPAEAAVQLSDNAPRVIPVGKNLAFVTSEKTVVLIDKELKEVASFSTEA